MPGIEQYASLRLNELATQAPRPIAALWRMTSEALGPGYGAITVGELLQRFGQSAA